MTTPLSVLVCHLQAGLAMTNLCTKFEVCISTRYGWERRRKKYKMGGLGYSQVT